MKINARYPLVVGALINAGAVALGLGGLVVWADYCEHRRRRSASS